MIGKDYKELAIQKKNGNKRIEVDGAVKDQQVKPCHLRDRIIHGVTSAPFTSQHERAHQRSFDTNLTNI